MGNLMSNIFNIMSRKFIKASQIELAIGRGAIVQRHAASTPSRASDALKRVFSRPSISIGTSRSLASLFGLPVYR